MITTRLRRPGWSRLSRMPWNGLTVAMAMVLALVLFAARKTAAETANSSDSDGPPPPAFQQTPNPAAAGLWMGEITLRAVSYPATGAIPATQTSAQLRILLHVDGAGNVKLLKDVVLASKDAFPFAAIIVTKPSLLATLPVQRDLFSNVKGQRFSTVAFDFTDNDSDPNDIALNLAGGLGEKLECVGTLVLDKNHPTNPFRHKFHPDHANEGAKGYSITRSLKLQFSVPIQNIGGVDQLFGSYEETITGLHRAALTAQGTVRLSRVATTSTLNQ